MTEEPKLPRKLKRGDRTAAKADEAEYPTGIGLAGCTGLKDVISAGVHGSVADGAGAWRTPGDLTGAGGYVSVKKPRAGARYRYIRLKNTVYDEKN